MSAESYCQDYPRKEIDLAEYIQTVFPNPTEDLPYEELYEAFSEFYQNPLDLNHATRAELNELYLLSEVQVSNFLKYRESLGYLLSIYELQVIPQWDLQTIYKVLPFVVVENKESSRSFLKRVLTEENRTFTLRYERTLETAEGFRKIDSLQAKYLGSPYKLYLRMKVQKAKDYSFGVTLEKDAGESFMDRRFSPNYFPDFISAHAYLENKGKFKRIAIGDYQVQFGQGLLLGSGFNPGKGGETVSIVRRNNMGIRPYTSSVESGYFRGAALTYSAGILELSGFFSSVNDDGKINSDSLSEESVRSLQISGFHRTRTEIDGRKKINHRTYGFNLDFNLNSNNFALGFTFLNSLFEVPIRRKPTRYNRFEFEGKHNYNYGIHYSWLWQNFNFFGELGRSKSNGVGLVAGIIGSLSSRSEISFVYRKYDKDFHSFYGQAFGENSRNINEEGFYIGLRVSPGKKVIFSMYYDRFFKPYFSYQAYAPSRGNGCLAKVTYQPSKVSAIIVQLRWESKEKNKKNEAIPFVQLEEEENLNGLVNLTYKFNQIQFLSRAQATRITQGGIKSWGMAISQTARVDLGRADFTGQVILFDTDNYATRQYVNEKDTQSSFSVPASFGQGIRYLVVVHCHLIRNLSASMRLARTSKNNTDSIGSGLSKITGSHKTDLKFQLNYKF